jgi:hypothetical protein
LAHGVVGIEVRPGLNIGLTLGYALQASLGNFDGLGGAAGDLVAHAKGGQAGKLRLAPRHRQRP